MTSSETTKTFVVPTRWLGRRMPRLWDALARLNARKLGKRRRGRVQLTGFEGFPKDDGTTELLIKLAASPHRLRCIDDGTGGLRKFSVYECGDIGKVVKDLTVAHNRLAKGTLT